MIDAIDEYALGNLEKFDGKYKLTNIGREGLSFDGDEDDKDQAKEDEEQFSQLTKFLKTQLGSKVEKVVLSKRLTQSPTALVSGQHGWTANMERIIKAQALADPNAKMMYSPRKTLEINPRHPILVELNKRVQADENDAAAKDIADLMYETAVLQSGFSLDDAGSFAQRIIRMMNQNLNLDPNAAPIEEPEVAKTPKETEEENTSAKDEL